MTSPTGRRVDRGTAWYAWSWIALGITSAIVSFLLTDRSELTTVGLWPLTLYVLAVAAAELVQLRVPLERAEAGFTLVEVAITAGLLLLPLPAVVIATALGSTLAQLARGLDVTRAGFNAAMATTGTAVAALVLWFWPVAGPTVADRPVLGALVGMGGYAAVNVAAMVGLMVRYAGPDAHAPLRQQGPLTVAATLGTTAVGVVVAALWEFEPVLTVLALAPAGAIHLAARGERRTQELLAVVRSDRDRLTQVVDGASDGIVLLDGDGSIRVWSRGMQALTGIPGEEVAGRSVGDVLTDQVRLAEEPVRGRWLLDGPSGAARQQELDAELVHRDGSRRVVREHHALLLDDRGRATGDVVVVRDISRQAELERLRSDFVARISHELRTPLTPIRGFATVLLRRGHELDEAQRQDALTRIVERADHLGQVVEDLLLVTRTDADEVETVAAPIDPLPTLEEVVTRIAERYPDHRIELDRGGFDHPVLADHRHLDRIVAAILDNACRYAPTGTAVTVTGGPSGELMGIEVADRGPGIPPDKREAVFEPFHRLEDPMTMRTGGVGLGLFLGRRLAQAMGGSLDLGPRPGGGTVARLLLRRAAPHDPAAAATTHDP